MLKPPLPCFLFQETHTLREPDRLQDIRAEQKTTELDRGERCTIGHTETNNNTGLVFVFQAGPDTVCISACSHPSPVNYLLPAAAWPTVSSDF